MNIAKELQDETLAYLRQTGGVTDIRFVKSKRHAKIVFQYRGQSLMTVISRSPSDYRAVQNQLQQLKRILRDAEARVS